MKTLKSYWMELVVAAVLAVAAVNAARADGITTPGGCGPNGTTACQGTTITATTGFVGPYFAETNSRYFLGAAFGGLTLNSVGGVIWTNSGVYTGTQDLFLTRYAAGQLMISGDGTGTAANKEGWVLGTGNASNDFSYMWATNPASFTASNYAFASNGTTTYLQGTTSVNLVANASTILSITSTAGAGPSITAGTAQSAVNALAITQTWSYNSAAITGILANFTDTSSHPNTLIFDFQVGSASKLSLTKAGGLTAASVSFAPLLDFGITSSGMVTYGRNDTSSKFVSVGYDGTIAGMKTVTAGGLFWTNSASNSNTTLDTGITRKAAGIVAFGASGTVGDGTATLFLAERTAPSAPAADGAHIYAVDNGGGKTQLCALFSSGAAQCFATQP